MLRVCTSNTVHGGQLSHGVSRHKHSWRCLDPRVAIGGIGAVELIATAYPLQPGNIVDLIEQGDWQYARSAGRELECVISPLEDIHMCELTIEVTGNSKNVLCSQFLDPAEKVLAEWNCRWRHGSLESVSQG